MTGTGSGAELASAYTRLREGALVVTREGRSLGVFHGPKAADVINGLVTNDVAALAPGGACYAAALTAKGKVIADLFVLRRHNDVLVDVSPRAAAGWWEMVRKYVNPRLSRHEDISGSLGSLGVFGPRWTAVLEAATGTTWGDLAPNAHRELAVGDVLMTVARLAEGGVDGGIVYFPADAREAVVQALTRGGAAIGDASALEVTRIEAGRPTWGVDMDDTTLTQEARLDALDAVSYSKGCYTGQETVARLHFRGHVNRLLRGVRIPEGAQVPRGAALVRPDGSVVGELRSTAHSPRLGSIGLAMVRREVEPGTPVLARWGDGGETTEVLVTDLPFAD